MQDYAKGMLDISLEASRLGMEVGVLKDKLSAVAENTAQIAQDGLSVTTTAVHNTASGRVEIITGNTETAGRGKLSKTQTGETNWTPTYVIAAIVAVVLIAMTMGHR
jgi:hypothetical protein